MTADSALYVEWGEGKQRTIYETHNGPLIHYKHYFVAAVHDCNTFFFFLFVLILQNYLCSKISVEFLQHFQCPQ